MKVELPEEITDALGRRLMKPELSREDQPIFALDPPLALALRLALDEARKNETTTS